METTSRPEGIHRGATRARLDRIRPRDLLRSRDPDLDAPALPGEADLVDDAGEPVRRPRFE